MTNNEKTLRMIMALAINILDNKVRVKDITFGYTCTGIETLTITYQTGVKQETGKER